MREKKWYDIKTDKKYISKERSKARELKNSSWWKKKLSEGICYYCKEHFKPEELTMDHIVPISRGGKSNKGNIVTACFKCNQSKGLDTPVDTLLDILNSK